MTLEWIHERPPSWDRPKREIIGRAPEGIFDPRFRALREGESLPGEWWRAERAGEVVGYGWLDVVWGDAEILLAVAPSAQGTGVGSFILSQLGLEAQARGLNYVYNDIPPHHPDGDALRQWLQERGFKASGDGTLMRAASFGDKGSR